jgi:hypothetical protein
MQKWPSYWAGAEGLFYPAAANQVVRGEPKLGRPQLEPVAEMTIADIGNCVRFHQVQRQRTKLEQEAEL